MATPNQVLDIARGEIGYNRWADPKEGSKYGRWFAQLSGDSYYGTSGVPYCAMYVSWVFAQAGQSAPGLPGAYCPWIVDAGRNAGATVSTRNAQAGDIVLFDWGGDGVSDHVGIVEANNGSYLTTIEGNTSSGNDSNGGKVQRRTRAYSTIVCIIRPPYNSQVGWVKEDRGWWWRNPDGSYPANCWQQIDGLWYAFDPEGYARKGWFKDTDGTWYYLLHEWEGIECAMARSEVRLIDGEFFAFAPSGAMMTSAVPIGANGHLVLS